MMNIIEKLGGYDNAKKLRGTTSNALLDMKTWQVHVDDIDEALLEYRREHNIFEVGDKVVSDIGNTLVSEVIFIDGRMARLKNSQFDHVYNLFYFRHATPEEIQAGRRL